MIIDRYNFLLKSGTLDNRFWHQVFDSVSDSDYENWAVRRLDVNAKTLGHGVLVILDTEGLIDTISSYML